MTALAGWSLRLAALLLLACDDPQNCTGILISAVAGNVYAAEGAPRLPDRIFASSPQRGTRADCEISPAPQTNISTESQTGQYFCFSGSGETVLEVLVGDEVVETRFVVRSTPDGCHPDTATVHIHLEADAPHQLTLDDAVAQ